MVVLCLKKKKIKKVRESLMEVLKYSRNTKLVLMSATPMFNSASEIVFLLNL